MGEVINFAEKLGRLRRRCRRLTEEQRRVVLSAQKYVRCLDEELLQQLDVIGDDTATDMEKDEAFAAIPLLELMLRERLERLTRLQTELLHG